MVTPFTKETKFFSKVSVSGAHRQSLSRIRQKQADLASIDGLTWSMLEMYAPEALKGCRILTLTPPAPAPAFVTEKETSQEMIELFRNALKNAFDEPKFNLVAKNLFLENTQIIPENAYDCITEMERISIEDL
jgi:ABC-type phosphate/phosphonate transport system substrate-binding protein